MYKRQHSLRLVLRAGALFLGSYILAYSLVLIAENYLQTMLHWLIGGHRVSFWIRWEPLIELLHRAPFETLRLCLLAVAFRRWLELFRKRVKHPAVVGGPVPVGVG